MTSVHWLTLLAGIAIGWLVVPMILGLLTKKNAA